MSNKKVSELEEASAANEYDYLMIIQNGVNKKIQASKIGTGQSGSGGDTLPIGAILPFSGDVIPNGWLLCDGSIIEQEDYPELFEVLAGNYGIINREEIRLPDLRGKVTVGKDSTDADFDTLGNTGGEKTHTLTVDEMPSHTHEIKKAGTAGGDGSGLAYSSTATTNSAGVLNTGNSQAHNNLQPYIVTNYIIKAKMTIVTNGEVIQENDTASTTNVYSAVAVDNKIKTNIVTGQEVATNEYIDGKRVYKIIIQENNVTLASNTTHTLAHNILNCKEIIEGQYLLRYKDGSTYYNYFDWQGVKHFRASNTDIQLIMGIADSTFEYIKYTLKYTKN